MRAGDLPTELGEPREGCLVCWDVRAGCVGTGRLPGAGRVSASQHLDASRLQLCHWSLRSLPRTRDLCSGNTGARWWLTSA